jgi:hypothetical protein
LTALSKGNISYISQSLEQNIRNGISLCHHSHGLLEAILWTHGDPEVLLTLMLVMARCDLARNFRVVPLQTAESFVLYEGTAELDAIKGPGIGIDLPVQSSIRH